MLPFSTPGKMRLGDLRVLPGNARTHSEAQVQVLERSLESFGMGAWIVVQKGTGVILAGHGRRLGLLRKLPPDAIVDVLEMDVDDETAMAYSIADNRIQELSGWDDGLLRAALSELDNGQRDMLAMGYGPDALDDLFGRPRGGEEGEGGPGGGGGSSEAEKTEHEVGKMHREMGAPPFTVLDAGQAFWQDRMALWLDLGLPTAFDAKAGDWLKRKTSWSDLGLRSEAGRDEDLLWTPSSQSPAVYKLRNEMRAATGIDPSWQEIEAEAKRRGIGFAAKTSIFDPVLCELLLTWYSAAGWSVLDPFAGGSVRGVVSAALGRRYTGIDLRPEQVEENVSQWLRISGLGQTAPADGSILSWPSPRWVIGDSRAALDRLEDLVGDGQADQFDLLLSCPPYADLEVYSQRPEDLSRMAYPAFLEAYREIIAKACARLRDDRFACWVVGDVRDDRGILRDFRGDTVRAFVDAGLGYYNDGILLGSLGSVAMRTGRIFKAGRKLGRVHQDVLVFVKGDPGRAAEALGEITPVNPFPAAASAFAARS